MTTETTLNTIGKFLRCKLVICYAFIDLFTVFKIVRLIFKNTWILFFLKSCFFGKVEKLSTR